MNNINYDFLSWWIGDEPDFSAYSFDRVIFLDIDGVLNDEGENRSKGIVIDDNMVASLKRIVIETDAKIVLSSSWRLEYKRFHDNGFSSDDKDILRLHQAFTNNNLLISGTVPLSQWSGPRSRPIEIRAWLEHFPDMSYVILDDDDFWMWEEYGLKEHVVLTRRKICNFDGRFEKVRGLMPENVDEAINILLTPLMSR